jgi:alkanesulfonate monooxygenase SsuD/methylene tetrahydromethanopterin reductase-like flavin-dependent oxidoreductase (luciferase family)
VFVTLHMSPQSRSAPEDIERFEEVIEHALLADAAGIAAISLTEHHLGGFNTYCDALPFGMFLAGKLTHGTYIALHVVQTPLMHPVRLAEQCNMLDVMTRGRCMIALAPGSPRQTELDAFGMSHNYGVSAETRADMTRQRIDAMLRAWSWTEDGQSVDISTDYDRGRVSARLTPTSFRRPHPLIGRATLTAATIAETGRMGLPVIFGPTPDREAISIYRDALESAGHSDEVVSECNDWLGFVSLFSLAETEREAGSRLDQFIDGGGSSPIVTAANQGTPEWIADWKERQALRNAGSMPVTPGVLVERLLALKDYGINHARVMLAEIPGQRSQNLESLHLFLEEVLPHLGAERLRDPATTVFDEAAVAPNRP